MHANPRACFARLDLDFGLLRTSKRREAHERGQADDDDALHCASHVNPKCTPSSPPVNPSGKGGMGSLIVTARNAELSKNSTPLPVSSRTPEISPPRPMRKYTTARA